MKKITVNEIFKFSKDKPIRQYEVCNSLQELVCMLETTEFPLVVCPISIEEKEKIMKANRMKHWIDNATYEELFRKWRFAPPGDPYFMGEVGDYYSKVMGEKKPSDEEHTRISKKIGW